MIVFNIGLIATGLIGLTRAGEYHQKNNQNKNRLLSAHPEGRGYQAFEGTTKITREMLAMLSKNSFVYEHGDEDKIHAAASFGNYPIKIVGVALGSCVAAVFKRRNR